MPSPQEAQLRLVIVILRMMMVAAAATQASRRQGSDSAVYRSIHTQVDQGTRVLLFNLRPEAERQFYELTRMAII
jgi:hypothetical protein